MSELKMDEKTMKIAFFGGKQPKQNKYQREFSFLGATESCLDCPSERGLLPINPSKIRPV
jgi:hypothetical protein